jgi:hypothetical protein
MAEAALNDQQKTEVQNSYSNIRLTDFIESDIESFVKALSV